MTLQLLISSFLPLFVFFCPPCLIFWVSLWDPTAALVVSHLLAHKASPLLSPVLIPALLWGHDPRLWFGLQKGSNLLAGGFPFSSWCYGLPSCLSQSSQQLFNALCPVLFKACGRALHCLLSGCRARVEDAGLCTLCPIGHRFLKVTQMHQGASFLSYFPVLGHHLLPTSHPATTWTSNLPTLLLAHLPLLLFFPPLCGWGLQLSPCPIIPSPTISCGPGTLFRAT